MKQTIAILAACAAVLGASGCAATTDDPGQTVTNQKPFAAGGRIVLKIASGDCEVTLSPTEVIRVTMRGNVGNAKADITTNGTEAGVQITDTPHNNFHCAIDVPKAEELRVSLGGGDLRVANIADTTDVQNGAGDTTVSVGDSAAYASVDASVGTGDLAAGPFGAGQSGIAPKLNWSGSGKRTLSVRLGAGSLTLR